MAKSFPCLLLLLLAIPGLAQVVVFEGDAFPERATPPWERIGTFDADRWIEEGLFFQYVELGVWAPPPFGEFDGYRRFIPEYASTASFFAEWVVQTDVEGSEVDGSPVVLTLSGNSSSNYHFTMTESEVRFLRDVPLQLELYVPIQAGVPHTYRLEIINSNSYFWYIDGEVANSGTSLGPYPTESSLVQASARYYLSEHTTNWDYIRYGVVPADASGDFDCDGDVDETDAYFFVDCLLGPDYAAAGPGCQWADMNADGTADGKDIAHFVDAVMTP